MKLNPEILQAIRAAIDYYGTTSQFAKAIGVAHSTVLFWLKGKTANISGSVWDRKVRRVLSRFMPKPERPGRMELREEAQPYLSRPADPMKKAGRKVPAIPFSKMVDLDITMQLPVAFVRFRKTCEIPFANEVTDFSFGLILDRADYCPCLPLGSALLVGGFDYAQEGDLVVGKTRQTERLFLCRYRRIGNRISLAPMDPDLPMMEWEEAENAEKVFWIFPVKEIFIDLNAHIWSDNELIPRTAAGMQG